MASVRFHGTTLRSRLAPGFELKEIQHPPGVFIPKHSHSNAHVGFILAGGFTETFTRKTLECRPLSVSYIAPGLPHTDDFQRGVRCVVLEIDAARLEQMREVAALRDPIFVNGGRAAWLTLQMYREALRGDSVSPLAIEGLAFETLAELSRPAESLLKQNAPPWLERARELLHARFGQTCTHDDVANEAGVHPVYLATLFRRHFGCTIGEYVRRLRIEFAAAELANSERSLSEIGLAAGFSDQSHFSKLFKRHTGMSPGSFRGCLPGRRRARYLRPLQDLARGRCFDRRK